MEGRLEREFKQYNAARIKAADKYISIIMDWMDQKKTCLPFYTTLLKLLVLTFF
jgi:hypothetical protein